MKNQKDNAITNAARIGFEIALRGNVSDIFAILAEVSQAANSLAAVEEAEEDKPITPAQVAIVKPEWDKMSEFLGLSSGKTAPEPSKEEKFQAMRQTLRAGVKIVTAPQLFPTPPPLAERMAELAEIGNGDRVLEPSAGTGNLIVAMADSGARIVAIEHSIALADGLRRRFYDGTVEVIAEDFLQCNGSIGTFDRVVMNPPFKNGADILHIRHALNKLNPGGKLVAICCAGPRQHAALQPLADHWEELPDGTFSEQGTNVRTVLLVITKAS